VLDLFSGVGSFGLECLSRGVKYVTFVENYSGVLNVLKKNVINLKGVENYKIIEKDINNNSFFFRN
jgi:16S rRNA (guanine966-N2)-methyltransferase